MNYKPICGLVSTELNILRCIFDSFMANCITFIAVSLCTMFSIEIKINEFENILKAWKSFLWAFLFYAYVKTFRLFAEMKAENKYQENTL
jgi:hypothetical protein